MYMVAIWIRNSFSIHFCVHGIKTTLNPGTDFIVFWLTAHKIKIKNKKKFSIYLVFYQIFGSFLNLVVYQILFFFYSLNDFAKMSRVFSDETSGDSSNI